jgi:SAM-dependent methyltransferase
VPKSTLRLAEHQAVASLAIDGDILDIGGHRHSEYHRLIRGDHKIDFANISNEHRPDLVFDAEEPWPVKPASYDAVLMFNFLEHVFDHRSALIEANKALKPHGRLIVTVPFMFHVHASPSDYFRYTEFALRKLIELSGFDVVELKPLGTGAFSVAWQAVQGPLPEPIAWIGRTFCEAADRLFGWIKPGNKLGPDQCPLGYYLEARPVVRSPEQVPPIEK